jgi:uncharacterized protein (TIGR02453 family)
MTFSGFDKAFFAFLRELAANNDRAWFEDNRQRYKDEVAAPAAAFITAFGPKLKRVSPHFVADPKPVGGSMFRIHRDTRFGHDKRPYETHIGIQFRHAAGKDAHAPGFYLNLEPKRVFYGGGVWKPAPPLLEAVRAKIAAEPAAWKKAIGAAAVKETFGALQPGEPLARPPRGFAPDHPCIDDLRKRSYFLTVDATEADAGKPAFLSDVAEAYLAAKPVMRFLTQAAGQPF